MDGDHGIKSEAQEMTGAVEASLQTLYMPRATKWMAEESLPARSVPS